MLVTTDFYLFINAWAHETMPEQIRQNNTQWQCECTKHPKYTTQRKFISSSCGQAGITSLKWKLCHTSKSRTKMTHRCNWCLFLMFSDAKPHSQLANWQIVVWFFFLQIWKPNFRICHQFASQCFLLCDEGLRHFQNWNKVICNCKICFVDNFKLSFVFINCCSTQIVTQVLQSIDF